MRGFIRLMFPTYGGSHLTLAIVLTWLKLLPVLEMTLDMRMRKIAADWLPEAAKEKVRRLRGAHTHRSYRTSFPSSFTKWAALQGSREGESCFVLGNGPSTGLLDVQAMRAENLITMNYFARHPLAHTVDPLFHCAADPPETQATPFQPGLFDIGERYSVMSYRHYNGEGANSIPRHLDILFVHMGRSWSWVQGRSALNIAEGIGNCQSTAVLGIAIALHMGFSPIFLVGMEHNFLASPETGTATTNTYKHFYADADPVSGSSSSGDFHYLDHIQLVQSVFRQHSILSSIARKEGRRIINLTPDTYLDTYELGKLPKSLLL